MNRGGGARAVPSCSFLLDALPAPFPFFPSQPLHHTTFCLFQSILLLQLSFFIHLSVLTVPYLPVSERPKTCTSVALLRELFFDDCYFRVFLFFFNPFLRLKLFNITFSYFLNNLFDLTFLRCFYRRNIRNSMYVLHRSSNCLSF